MAKKHSIDDIRNLKKVSSIAKAYKDGASTSYIYKLRKEGKIEFITIDGVHFLDITTLPDEIRKNLKK